MVGQDLAYKGNRPFTLGKIFGESEMTTIKSVDVGCKGDWLVFL